MLHLINYFFSKNMAAKTAGQVDIGHQWENDGETCECAGEMFAINSYRQK